MRATAKACANIALVKYWGKRDTHLNLPAAGSLSLTLAELHTTTTVDFSAELDRDVLILDGVQSDAKRLGQWLDIVRHRANITKYAHVQSHNGFPTASGLASSASAYAALAVAASHAAGLTSSKSELSELARRGSGSAARSIFGGLVVWHKGQLANGTDSIAEPIDSDWPLRMVIAIVGGGKKKAVSSRDAMEHCAATSPLYQAWLDCVADDIRGAQQAIALRDLSALGVIVEGSAMAMHAAAMASRPPVRYWQPATMACLECVQSLQQRGIPAFPTMDAGPHVKVLTDEAHFSEIAEALRKCPNVSEVLISGPGEGAALL